MKKLAVLLLAVASACNQTLATNKTATLSVKGWTCASCAVSTRIALNKLVGVAAVTTSDEKKEVVVSYDDSRVTPARMIEAIEKLGYSSSLSETSTIRSSSDAGTPASADVARTTLSVTGISC